MISQGPFKYFTKTFFYIIACIVVCAKLTNFDGATPIATIMINRTIDVALVSIPVFTMSCFSGLLQYVTRTTDR